MGLVLTIRRTGPAEPIPLNDWRGEHSIGIGELPIEFELRTIRYGKGVDASGHNGTSLTDRKRDHRKYGIKTAQQCLDQLKREFHSFTFEVISRQQERVLPKPEDWTLLGVTEETPFREVRKSYIALAKEMHPDKKGGSELRMKELSAAYARIKGKINV
jgi:DnaJ-class molecular chaperone with C-terminal Zn finger domain